MFGCCDDGVINAHADPIAEGAREGGAYLTGNSLPALLSITHQVSVVRHLQQKVQQKVLYVHVSVRACVCVIARMHVRVCVCVCVCVRVRACARNRVTNSLRSQGLSTYPHAAYALYLAVSRPSLT